MYYSVGYVYISKIFQDENLTNLEFEPVQSENSEFSELSKKSSKVTEKAPEVPLEPPKCLELPAEGRTSESSKSKRLFSSQKVSYMCMY